jgi:hypothetical protein
MMEALYCFGYRGLVAAHVLGKWVTKDVERWTMKMMRLANYTCIYTDYIPM